MAEDVRKTYSNGEITVVWQPARCIHSHRCFQGLPAVFDPSRKPWVDVEAASSNEIARQVRACPSGALSLAEDDPAAVPVTRIELRRNGPLRVAGPALIVDADGRETVHAGPVVLCRCGASKNKPFCDGSHRDVKFEG